MIKINGNEYQKLYEVIVGSHAYGLNDEHSDKDYMGLFHVPSREYVQFTPEPPQQFMVNDGDDSTFYSLKRYFHLLNLANPNILEFLWIPEKCVINKHPVMDILISNRDVFLTQKAKYTYTGYSFAQLNKARGTNKWVSNPKPKERPVLQDYCKILVDTDNGKSRTKPCDLNLDLYQVSRVEGGHNLYRLYFYGEESKGVFSGGKVVCQSISIEDENKFAGLMIVDEDLYKKDSKDWENYWDWIKNRNEARWNPTGDDSVVCNFKNLSHCIRLMHSAINIFSEGFPLVELKGDLAKKVLDIKRGLWKYEDIIGEAERLEAEFDCVFERNKDKFPHHTNDKKVNEIYLKMIEHLEGKHWN